MSFVAWPITDKSGVTDFEIAGSPVGRVRLVSWGPEHHAPYVPAGGSAVILPTAPLTVRWSGALLQLVPGCFAVAPGGAHVHGGAGVMIYTPQYVGLSQMGGPVEDAGRLRYIDGCSDSLLVCPPKVGEPCLNLLHLPAGIHQTQHTHPSDRIGIILRGSGLCKTPDGDTPLAGGMFWYIPAETVHSFHTEAASLDVFAWHPDSDFGPSHDAHPMLNRTIVEGVAVSDARHQGIRTGEIRE